MATHSVAEFEEDEHVGDWGDLTGKVRPLELILIVVELLFDLTYPYG